MRKLLMKDAFRLFSNTRLVFGAAILLRVGLLVYGHLQDRYSSLKYTDIDYFVFTDAARYVSRGRSPYMRDTYRYTPLLAWMLLPTTWSRIWFDFGKALFAASDIVTGWLIIIVLRSSMGMTTGKAVNFANIWLLNPMVAIISTRGSSEGLLAVIVMALLWATMKKHIVLAGCLLGVAVHFKIYPFIYGASIVWWLDETQASIDTEKRSHETRLSEMQSFFNYSRIKFVTASLITFMVLNVIMLFNYGSPFAEHTYFYHLTRTDHRHNFSPYNILLYLNSSPARTSSWHPETLAFVPQLVLSAIIVPVVLAKTDLPSTMLVQTFSFVTFNKVCTSQYFLWHMVFLPFYMPKSTLLGQPRLGLAALVFWLLGQALWLYQGFQLEFLGRSVFVPGLWSASLLFFAINIWILGLIIADVRQQLIPALSNPGKKFK